MNGYGPGGGAGGGGGYDCCHGTGGGGGSFKERGGFGYSDLCRNTKYPHVWARSVVAFCHAYYVYFFDET